MTDQDRQWVKTIVGGLLAIVAIILAIASAGCAYNYVPVARLPIPQAGLTTCDEMGHPVIVISVAVTENEVYFVRTHEMEHVYQMGNDCKGFLERYRADPIFRFRMEAQAYCADLRARVDAGYPRDTLVTLLANHLQQSILNKLSVDSVRTMLPCGRGHGTP